MNPAPIRRTAREMVDNQLLDPAMAAAIKRVPVWSVAATGRKLLIKEQANGLLRAPDPHTLKGKPPHANLIGCGVRRAEIVWLDVGSIQRREACWLIPDLIGKGTAPAQSPSPSGVKLTSIWGLVRPESRKAGSSIP